MSPGTRIGVYEILAPIGEGGMGQVFRARDTKLDRDVAIKILPEAFAHDADRLARFQREAKTLAALNHPHIAAIYGLEEGGGVTALVMELVDGEDLSQRIARGVIPIDEALPIAQQIAEALEAAHEQGIIHRDLKPANVKVRPDGTVKVLDFGLAKALDRDLKTAEPQNLSASPTFASPAMTQAGMILGTAAYMSPEQARGKAVDKRADIWAFGVVLYEMLTATRIFAGESVAETLGLIFSREPDLATLPAETPARVRALIARCLAKDPRRRLRDIGEARLALEGAFESAAPPTAAVTSSKPRGLLGWAVIAAALLVAVALGGIVGGRYLPTAAPSADTVRFEILPPADVTLSPAPVASAAQLAISPDGRRLAFVATKRRGVSQIWLRPLDSTEAQPLPGTEGASFPFWSPDGQSLAFFASGKLKKIDTTGGKPQVLCDAATGRGGAWSADGTIAFTANANSPIVRVAASGGAVTPLTMLDPARGVLGHSFPQFLPDGRHFLYFQRSTTPAEHAGIYVGSLDSSETTRVLATLSTGVYSSGFLWFVQAGSLFAQAFDVRVLRPTGDPIRVADGVGFYPNLGYMSNTVSATGVLVFGPSLALTTSVQPHGRGGAADGTPTPAGTFRSPRLSPDQKSLALAISEAGGGSDIWVLDLARRAMSRAVSDPGPDWFPVWLPDSSRLYFGSGRSGSTTLFEKTLGGKDELLVARAQLSGATYPTDISGDGRFLGFQSGSQSGYDLGVLSLAGERAANTFLTTPFNELQGRFSPNGRWMAYASDESGRFEIYVRPFPAASGQTQISLAGGMQPEWRRDGKELFYIATDGKLTAVPVTTDGAEFTAGTPQALFDVEVPEPSAPYQGDYAVTADGQRFFVNTVVDQPTRPALTVILNWRPEGKQ